MGPQPDPSRYAPRPLHRSYRRRGIRRGHHPTGTGRAPDSGPRGRHHRDFRRRVAQRYIVVELSPAFFDDAAHLARANGLRGYDAVQLAAATTLNRQRLARNLSTVTLVSADAELNRAALAEGLLVEDPNRYP